MFGFTVFSTSLAQPMYPSSIPRAKFIMMNS